MKNIILQNITIDEFKQLITDIVLGTASSSINISTQIDTAYLTRTEVSRLLRISLPTLHDWTKTGVIKAYRIGRRVLYKENEVKESLQIILSNKYKFNKHES